LIQDESAKMFKIDEKTSDRCLHELIKKTSNLSMIQSLLSASLDREKKVVMDLKKAELRNDMLQLELDMEKRKTAIRGENGS
jgi:hypothetical protein